MAIVATLASLLHIHLGPPNLAPLIHQFFFTIWLHRQLCGIFPAFSGFPASDSLSETVHRPWHPPAFLTERRHKVMGILGNAGGALPRRL